MMFFLVIHHFFPIFQEKQDILTAPWQPLGDFRARLTPEVLPAAKSHFIAEELQPRAAEVQNKHEKTRWKKRICSWKDMERTIFFATKPRAFLMNYDLLCYCTTVLLLYLCTGYLLYIWYEDAQAPGFARNICSQLCQQTNQTEFHGSGSQ